MGDQQQHRPRSQSVGPRNRVALPSPVTLNFVGDNTHGPALRQWKNKLASFIAQITQGAVKVEEPIINDPSGTMFPLSVEALKDPHYENITTNVPKEFPGWSTEYATVSVPRGYRAQPQNIETLVVKREASALSLGYYDFLKPLLWPLILALLCFYILYVLALPYLI